MPVSLRKYLFAFVSLTFLFPYSRTLASHLAGDEFTYKFLGDTIISSVAYQKYQLTLAIYIDCQNGLAEAIAQDNPAFLGIFSTTGTPIQIDTAVYSSSFVSLPTTSSGPCGIGFGPIPGLCTEKRTFVKEYYLQPSSTGYIIAYQRCCRNVVLTNVIDPGDSGVTYFCTIPSSGVTDSNNSAVFTYDPPQAAAINTPFVYNSVATDADGDSLSYELCAAYTGANDPNNSKPYPVPPPYQLISYVPSLSFGNPMSCSVPLAIDPVTGMLTGTPNLAGRYLIALCCHEWRGGVMINTVNREFELAVGDFAVSGGYQPFAGTDTTIMEGDSVNFNGTDAVSYLWTPGTYLSDTTISNPVGYFPVAGIFNYVLHGVSDSGCHGTDRITIQVLAHSSFRVPNAFTPNNDGINDYLIPIPLENSALISFQVYNRDGKLLYTETATQGDGWDGTYNGVKQPMGSYLWELSYQDNNGQTREMKGTATLIR